MPCFSEMTCVFMSHGLVRKYNHVVRTVVSLFCGKQKKKLFRWIHFEKLLLDAHLKKCHLHTLFFFLFVLGFWNIWASPQYILFGTVILLISQVYQYNECYSISDLMISLPLTPERSCTYPTLAAHASKGTRFCPLLLLFRNTGMFHLYVWI